VNGELAKHVASVGSSSDLPVGAAAEREVGGSVDLPVGAVAELELGATLALPKWRASEPPERHSSLTRRAR
jgi:hypothetical protein